MDLKTMLSYFCLSVLVSLSMILNAFSAVAADALFVISSSSMAYKGNWSTSEKYAIRDRCVILASGCLPRFSGSRDGSHD
jgi:hypothetical protein